MSNLHDGYANQLYTLYSQTKNTQKRLNEQLSKYDKNLSFYYHEIEHLNITPKESYDYMIALQNILIKRRAVKQELYHINLILRTLRDSVKVLKPQRRLAVKRTTEYNQKLSVNLTISEVL